MIGQIFYVGALEALAPPALVSRIPSLLRELVQKELVRPGQSDFVDEGAYEFRHLLIRDAAYESLSKESRADLHVRFADWFEEQSGDRSAEYAEIVGWHLEQAHRYLSELGTLDAQPRRARTPCRRSACRGWLDGLRARGRLRRRESPVASPGVDADRGPQPATGARRPRRGSPLERAVPGSRSCANRSDRARGRGWGRAHARASSTLPAPASVPGRSGRRLRAPGGRSSRRGDALRGERRRLRGGSRLAGRLLGSLGSVSAGTYAPGRGARFRARPARARPALPAAGPGWSARLAGVGDPLRLLRR